VAEEHKEIDAVSGTATTGHDWDGIRELNTPLPRWWLWTFYACIVWAVGYWVVYPAWPLLTTSTEGITGWHARSAVVTDLEQLQAQRGPMMQQINTASVADIAGNPQLLDFSRAVGRVAFADNCAPCHGAGGGGTKGYPNLNDDDWLWGGTPEAIERTIQHGIRSGDPEARDMAMPRFGLDGILKPAEITDAAQFVLSLSGKSTDPAAAERGKQIFADNCVACHGAEGKGNQEVGAPNLTDGIWLYGGKLANIEKTIETGRGGVMPYWTGRLDPVTIKMLAAYVHSLGGGK
jgi:cytochrome c oxidase cbb3-type subunit 3